jgi:hypothetical protein
VLDVNKEAKDFVKNVVEGLKIGTNEFLLAVAWITKEGRRYHQKIPFVHGSDVTNGTNSERRPMSRDMCLSANNKILHNVHAFIPSEGQWVFNWTRRHAVPALLCPKALKKQSFLITDEDNQFLRASFTAMSNEDTYGKSKIRLCKWHKVSYMRNYLDNKFRMFVFSNFWKFSHLYFWFSNIQKFEQDEPRIYPWFQEACQV